MAGSNTLAKLSVQMNADSSRLIKKLEQAENRAKRWEKKTSRNVNSVKKAFVGLGLGIAAVKFASFINKSIEATDEIAKMSDALGLSTTAYQELSHGARIAGVEQSQLTSNLTAFVKRVGEARAGIGPLTSFLNKYDKQLLENIKNTTNQEQAFKLVADAIQEAELATDKAAIANAAFSRAGVTMVNLMRDGAEGIEKFATEAHAAGLVIDEELIRNSEVANDKLTVLSKTLSIKATAAVAGYSKEIGDLADTLLEFIHVASEAPKFVKFLAESFAASVHGAADPVRIAHKIEILQKRIAAFELTIEKTRTRAGLEGVVHLMFFGKDTDTKKQLAEANAELDKLLAKQKLFAGVAPVLSLVPPKKDVEPPKKEVESDFSKLYAKEQSALESSLEKKIETIDQYLATKAEREIQADNNRVFMVEDAFQNDIISWETRNKLIEGLAVKHEKNMEKITALGSKARLNIAKGILGNLATLMDSGSRKEFEIGKKAATAIAVVKGIEATMSAYAAGAQINPYVGAAYAAAAALVAIKNVQKIQSTSFDGGGGALSAAGGGVSAGTAIDNLTDIPSQEISEFPTNINITIEGGVADRDTAEAIADSLRQYIADGGRGIAA